MTDQIVDIGQVIVHGVLFDPKNTEAWRNVDFAESIYQSVPKLFDLLDERGVDYVLVGGIAMLAYVDGRNTQDIDLIVDPADLAKVPEIRIEDRNKQFARGWFGDLRVDFLFTKEKLFAKIRKQYATKKKFSERMVTCATVDGLLLTKLFALPDKYRQGHFERVGLYESDIQALIGQFHPDMQALLLVLAEYMLPSDVDEVRKIVAEIEERLARQSQRFGPPQE